MRSAKAFLAETHGGPEIAPPRSFVAWSGRPFIWFPDTVMILRILMLGWLTYDLRLASTKHAPAAGARLLWDIQRGEWTVILHDLPPLPAEKT